MGKPNPMKGIPRKDWPSYQEAKKAQQQAEFDAAAAAVIGRPPADAFANWDDQVGNSPIPPGGATINIEKQKLNSDSEQPTALPPDLFSGTFRKLAVYGLNGSTTDPLPGFVLYWFNDDGGTGIRPRQAQMSGWEFVKKDEVALTEGIVDGNVSLGSNVTYIVNPRATPPTRAYLMKKPLWLHEQHMADRERNTNQKIEQALALGKVTSASPQDRQYSKRDDPTSNLAPINISSHIVR